MSGITFMVDERCQKTAAVIDLRKHEQPDFHDALPAMRRPRAARKPRLRPAHPKPKKCEVKQL